MEILFLTVLKALILPPGSIIVGIAGGMLLHRWYRRVGRTVFLLSAICGVAVCLPAIAGQIARVTERYPPIAVGDIKAIEGEIIVILAGGKDHNRAEYGGVTVSKNTMERIRYGAVLARALHLPVLVSGGIVRGQGVGEATLMAEILEKEYGITPQWVEDQSRNTAENAAFSAPLIGTRKAILVTNALHMWRAVKSFSSVGVSVVPAPVASVAAGEPWRFSYYDFLPSEKALMVSRDALHELVGIVWYQLRY